MPTQDYSKYFEETDVDVHSWTWATDNIARVWTPQITADERSRLGLGLGLGFRLGFDDL